MLLAPFLLPLSLILIRNAIAQPIQSQSTSLAVHNITRAFDTNFENLAIRSNGQILATTTKPNASIYQVDPRGILPLTIIHTIPNVTSATGIVEGKPDVFYVASGDVNLAAPLATVPSSYSISEIDVRGLAVFPNGTLTRQPTVKRVASLPAAALPNGIAFARPHSDHLLVADSFRGLIWNVNVRNGSVGVTLNDTTTKGATPTGAQSTGANGLKVLNGTMYWTSTGTSSLFRVPIDEFGNVCAGSVPALVTSNLSCDDFVLDSNGVAYVASPSEVVYKVSPAGDKQIIAGTFNSSSSAIIGATAIRFGRLPSDLRRQSIYVTTNGGLAPIIVPGSAGVSRIDLA